MTENSRVTIHKLSSGVPGLDDVLGGGISEFSFNLIGGGPGSGKTTMAHQIVFANATSDRPALYLSLLGEPPLKMLRYQQQFTFFDTTKVNEILRFIHISREVMEQGLNAVLDNIVQAVEAAPPSFVVVDSFRALVRAVGTVHAGELELQAFVQRLALHLTGWQATTFLIGEFHEHETESNPVFTIADSVLWLTQAVVRNSMVRKLQIMKVRGQAQIPGLHTFRITNDGLQVFPRLPKPEERAPTKSTLHRRLSIGVSAVDEMLGGGIPVGYSLVIAGPSGSGKTVLSTQFIMEGVSQGEPGIIAVFEKRPNRYLTTTPAEKKMQAMVRSGQLKIFSMRPLDLSIDEALYELRRAVLEIGAKRVVIDSLSGFELALAPTFRDDFRESLYRMVGALTGMGVTVIMTVEITDSYIDLQLSPHGLTFLTDGIILQRYVELDGGLKKIIAVVKLRASQHSKDLRAYDINAKGMVIGETLGEYRELLTGVPKLIDSSRKSPT